MTNGDSFFRLATMLNGIFKKIWMQTKEKYCGTEKCYGSNCHYIKIPLWGLIGDGKSFSRNISRRSISIVLQIDIVGISFAMP